MPRNPSKASLKRTRLRVTTYPQAQHLRDDESIEESPSFLHASFDDDTSSNGQQPLRVFRSPTAQPPPLLYVYQHTPPAASLPSAAGRQIQVQEHPPLTSATLDAPRTRRSMRASCQLLAIREPPAPPDAQLDPRDEDLSALESGSYVIFRPDDQPRDSSPSPFTTTGGVPTLSAPPMPDECVAPLPPGTLQHSPSSSGPRHLSPAELQVLSAPTSTLSLPDLREQSNQISFLGTPEERLLLRMYRICRHPAVPRYLFDRLMSELRKGAAAGVDLSSDAFLSYSAATLYSKFSKLSPMKLPVTVPIAIESSRPQDLSHHRLPRQSTNITIFSVRDAVNSILRDFQTMSHLDNLVVNPTNRWNQINLAESQPGEVLSGKAMQDYIRHESLCPGLDLVVPFIIYWDEIGTSLNQRQSVTPVLLAFGILRHHLRYRRKYVRTIGYIPNFDKRTKAQKRAENIPREGKGRTVRNFHLCQAKIFEEIRQVQQEFRQQPRVVLIGNEARLVYLRLPIAFICGDAKAMDCEACRYSSYQNSSRLSRFCNITSAEAGVAGAECTEVTIDDVKPHVAAVLSPESTREQVAAGREALANLCTHVCHNSLWDVDIGGQASLPLPHDLMHIFMTIMKTMFSLLISPLSAGECARLDIEASHIFGTLRSGEKKSFPRIYFSNGITSLTMLSAREWVGTILMSLVLLRTRRGSALMEQCLTRSRARELAQRARDGDLAAKRTKLDNSGDVVELPPLVEVTVQQVVEVFEEILMFHAFATNGRNPRLEVGNGNIFNWDSTKEMILRVRIGHLQKLIQETFPRRAGSGWATQKFHELLHIPRNITMFGFPYQYIADWGERMLKFFGKNPSKTSQAAHADNLHDFSEMIADRVYETALLDYLDVSGEQESGDEEEDTTSELPKAATTGLDGLGFKIYQSQVQWRLEASNNELKQCIWSGRQKSNVLMEMPQLVVESILSFFEDGWVEGYTEVYVADDRDGEYRRLRCHPFYRGKQWYEWVLVNFNEPGHPFPPHKNISGKYEGTTPAGWFPVRLLGIICNPGYDPQKEEHPIDNPKVQCIIHSTVEDTASETALTETWELEYRQCTIQTPLLDENLNVLHEGQSSHRQVLRPVIRLCHPSQIKRRIMVVQEFSQLRSYIDLAVENSTTQSKNIVYIRDRKSYWAHTYSRTMDGPW